MQWVGGYEILILFVAFRRIEIKIQAIELF